MIDQVDEQVREWVHQTVGITPSLSPPDGAKGKRGVSLYLLELTDRPPARSNKRPPLQVLLHYLVTTWAGEPEEAHRLLGDLVFAAMEHPEFEVELDPVTPTTWAALGIAPRPSFILQVPLRKEQPEPPIKRVRQPLVVRPTPVTTLQGVVLGPDDIPLARAVVEIPGLRLTAHTDEKGRFSLANIPADPYPTKLRVRAKGQMIEVKLEKPVSDSEPFVVHFNLFE